MYVYNLSTGTLRVRIANRDANTGDNFGHSVAVAQNTLAVGAYMDDDDRGGDDTGLAFPFDATSSSHPIRDLLSTPGPQLAVTPLAGPLPRG